MFFEKSIQLKIWDKIAHINFRPFEEARRFIRSLKLKNSSEWKTYRRSGKRPLDIPSNPQNFYNNKGWISVGDFLGTGKVASQLIKYRPFKEARKFARSLKLKKRGEWNNFYKKNKLPTDIPAKPDNTYKNKGWKGMVDFLDSGYRTFQSFKKAKIFAKKSGITSAQEWKRQWKLGKIPNGFPRTPDRVYKNKGWKSWPDFLNSGWRTYSSFKSAKIFARKSRIKTSKQWRKQLKLGKIPRVFPYHPVRYYKNKGWKGWKDFLGTG